MQRTDALIVVEADTGVGGFKGRRQGMAILWSTAGYNETQEIKEVLDTHKTNTHHLIYQYIRTLKMH